MPLSPQNQRLHKLATKNGSDADLLLLDELNALEDTLKTFQDEVEEKIAELKDRVSPSSQEIKAVLEQTGMMMDKFSSVERMKGDTGEQGEKGDTGEQGERGEQGLQGERGEQGEKGEQSERGEKGETGADGKDGSPDTNEQIADKLNTKEEIIEQSVIKGLKKDLDRLKAATTNMAGRIMGGGGGRQPRVEDFEFDGDGTTTAFTLPAEPFGKGKLIWVYYDGQWLQRGKHFTIAGRTMTMTFTPASTTKVEGFLQYQ